MMNGTSIQDILARLIEIEGDLETAFDLLDHDDSDLQQVGRDQVQLAAADLNTTINALSRWERTLLLAWPGGGHA